ncbi:MAG: protein kinase [Planctomycetes bacterium]|nr:protein kinase [Planctomycetota bacterium]
MAEGVPETIGPYEVQREIGRGGMGVVYLARDTKLDRDVAIKALPDALAADPERLVRFEREAKLLASLHHSHIAGVYGLEEQDEARFLILEYVEGETLDALIEHGPLMIDDALSIARQIAEAVEAAHEKGIIHRDLKPANVKITPDGDVKVLDFGLAKGLDDRPSTSNLVDSPTAIAGQSPTMPGVILGTAGYMSPEQARGKPLDKRTDIWSFGCVLYEMLVGRQVFPGETATDSIGAILHKEPDWNALPDDTPPTVHLLLRRCLTKDRNHRLHDIADARVELEEAIADPTSSSLGPAVAAIPRASGRRSTRLVLALLAVLLLIAVAVRVPALVRSPKVLPGEPLRVSIPLPPGQALNLGTFTLAAISPDGRRIVYIATENGVSRMYVRSINDYQSTALPGTEDAFNPFFSPDGESVGFVAGAKLKKVSLAGGMPVELADVSNSVGASWGTDGSIIYTPHWRGGLWRVSVDGGEPQPLTTPDLQNKEASHRWPQILPGNKAVLFTIKTTDLITFDNARIAVVSFDTGEVHILVQGGMSPRYVPTGHLVYARRGTLFAAPFDLKRLRLTGSAVPVLQEVQTDTWSGAPQFNVSQQGALLYVEEIPGGVPDQNTLVVWVDRRGEAQPWTKERRGYSTAKLSPDGRQLVVGVGAANGNLWIGDVARGSLTRLTYGTGNNIQPIWTPDGTRITFMSDRQGSEDIFWMPADRSSPAELLLKGWHYPMPTSWTPDGSTLAFTETGPDTGMDIWVLSLQGEREPEPFLRSVFNEDGAVFSPDGGWIAYQSDESGRYEVYVQPYPGPGPKVQVSDGGGWSPLWSRDGRELFYHNGDAMMVVAVELGPAFTAATPQVLFEGRYRWVFDPGSPEYDVSADGQRFLMAQPREQEADITHLNLVLNWFEELKQRVPGGEK